ncbi:PaaI family thioesterase [Rhodovibrionaceae bacterium A322]
MSEQIFLSGAADQAARITVEDMVEVGRELVWVQQLNVQIEDIGYGTAQLRLPMSEDNLRPGGTVSGPAMMTLADYAMYAAVLGAIGRVELAVTTNLNMNFLRKPPLGDILADCRLLKLGKRLAYGEVLLHSMNEGFDEPVAHCTTTYSIPPNR